MGGVGGATGWYETSGGAQTSPGSGDLGWGVTRGALVALGRRAGGRGAGAGEAYWAGVAVLIGRAINKGSGSPGGGGSGYLGAMLTNACMYSYKTKFTSTDPATKTVSTSNVSETATAGYAKRGNGFAKITLVD